VEFETADEAGDAILNLQNSSLDGREIWVREDREDRGPRQ
jgi:RNA recognition motif-containing protein